MSAQFSIAAYLAAHARLAGKLDQRAFQDGVDLVRHAFAVMVAVTLAVFLRGRLDSKEVLPYMGAQVAAGVAAALVSFVAFDRRSDPSLDLSGRELVNLFPNMQPLWAASVTEIDPARTYRLSASRYTALGWIELQGKAFPMTSEGVTVRDVVIDWIKQRQVIP